MFNVQCLMSDSLLESFKYHASETSIDRTQSKPNPEIRLEWTGTDLRLMCPETKV